jgi:hypothetical protein
MKAIGILKNDRNLLYSNVYETPWDAERIFGCVCDLGYSGLECSVRECPYGDDPITTGQVDEIQALSCLCNGCTGTITLSFRGFTTRALLTTETVATLKEALEELPTIRTVTVSLDPNTETTICSTTGVSALITFTHEHGDVPSLVITSSLTGETSSVTLQADGAQAAYGAPVTTQKGTKEWQLCSGRGTCNFMTGICTCEPGFEPSDGIGGSGTISDCGYRNPSAGAMTACAAGYSISCSNRGRCSGGPNYQCVCTNGFYGHDCSRRRCPMGRAWFQEVQEDNVGHLDLVECSNAGTCDEIGVCRCFPGFEGVACNFVSCPVVDGAVCSGRGLCKTARDIARLTETTDFVRAGFDYGTDLNAFATWDADIMQGCWCNKVKLPSGLMVFWKDD